MVVGWFLFVLEQFVFGVYVVHLAFKIFEPVLE